MFVYIFLIEADLWLSLVKFENSGGMEVYWNRGVL